MAPRPRRPRWKADPNLSPAVVRRQFGPGAKVVQMGGGGFTVKPGPRGAPPPAPPAGPVGTPKPGTPRSEVLGLAPRPWIGSEGLTGPYKAEPRLDPTKWEWMQNESGRFFARPLTELSGLDPQSVNTIREFDAQTARQTGRIDQAYDAFAASARTDADAAAGRLADLARLSGAGYGADPTGQVLSQAAREGQATQSALTLGGLNRLPTLAEGQGLTAQEAFRAERSDDRRSFLTDLRGQLSESQAAAAEQAAEEARFRREMASDLRGQNLSFLGQLGGQQNDLQQALLGLQGQAQGRAQDLAIAQARLEQEANLAQFGAQVDLQEQAIGAQGDATKGMFRTPVQIKGAAGRTLGPWKVRPRPMPGVELEQATNGLWYGKKARGRSGSGASAGNYQKVRIDGTKWIEGVFDALEPDPVTGDITAPFDAEEAYDRLIDRGVGRAHAIRLVKRFYKRAPRRPAGSGATPGNRGFTGGTTGGA